ncbi:MAG TPA: glutamate-5-semialdehyde dehydrogenase [Oscillatoriales cyanobacterium M59_W2019_021]|nr:MAG: glutamate-5-semialdehyde dehydrogenase [Cyanobacteria bacterium J055]HIK31617.1 glutamate-5-semialdehyde dehydrogenase [Oscillatoriales cyanobacterium M4454_W2019_049]HIK50797.1 glutamate-5-semialdehyde dehydrogenase [Oscillatoriales cyanobacterium M59_W2019_021]
MTMDFIEFAPTPTESARRAYDASLILASTKGSDRDRAIAAFAEALHDRQAEILEANTLDLEASRDMAVPDLILDWLKLTPERLQIAVQILQRLVQISDPIRRVMATDYQVEYSQTYCQLMPLGVVALIYEAFPELGAIAAGMCLKTGNSLLLKGSSEASHTNLAIAQLLKSALEKTNLPSGCIEPIAPEGNTAIRELVCQNRYLSLVIPHGRPSLIQPILQQATVPVLQSAMGNCYLYWSPSGSLDLARWAILDSHQSQPDPVNAIEKVLIHPNLKSSSLTTLWHSLQEKGFEIRGDEALVREFPDLPLAQSWEWHQAYLSRTIAFKTIDSLEAAISWINQYSSGHANCLVTESYEESCKFTVGVNSAATYINASPRFTRNPKRGNSILLGMSNQKGDRRGFIGLEALTRVKHVIQGFGN